MSGSRSPTPTPNLLTSANTAPSPDPTTSRTPTYDQGTPTTPFEERLQPPTLRPTPSHSFHVAEIARSPPRRSLVRPAESSLEEPMAKRLRRASPKDREKSNPRSTSPSSDSQDDMADNEMDSTRSERPEPHPLTTSPVKKKRTRTLTTPHQSAVLHALLAQSRFPTTAMREEVGRTIGLSARKVQIWFQNQRQKARRPRSQSDTPTNRPPQYGPFPTPPDSGSVGSFAIAGPSQSSSSHSGGGFYARQIDTPLYGGYSTSDAYNSPVESTTRLLGPGMPGSELYIAPTYRAYGRGPDAPVTAPPAEHFLHGQDTHFDPSSSHFAPQSNVHTSLSRPWTSHLGAFRQVDLSRTLPPLPLTRPVTSSTLANRRVFSLEGPTYSAPMAPFVHPRSSSPESRFAHQAPGSPVTLPPPYTLQPQPHWDEAILSPLPRPGSALSLSRSHSSSASSTSWREGEAAESSQVARTADRTPQPPLVGPPPSARSGRYDPVRAIFVPHVTDSPTLSPSAHDENDTDGNKQPARVPTPNSTF